MGPAEITVLDSAAHISAQRVAAVQRIHSVSDLASTTGPVEYFYASDASAIIEHTKKIVFLEDDDVISIDVSHPQGARIIPSCQLESWYAYTNQTRFETLIAKNSTLTVQFTQLACARGLAWLPKTSAAQISPPARAAATHIVASKSIECSLLGRHTGPETRCALGVRSR